MHTLTSKHFARSIDRALITLFVLAAALMLAGCNLDASVSSVISGTPVVTLTAPSADLPYAEGVTVYIQAQIANAGADIDRVEIGIDTAVIATIRDANPEGAAAFTLAHGWTAAGIGTRQIAITAYRADGSASAPATSAITVIAGSGIAVMPTTTRTAIPSPLTPLAPTADSPAVPQPTFTPAIVVTQSPTEAPTLSAPPIASFDRAINVRSGPGLTFDRIASFTSGQTTDVLAVNPAGDWLKVRLGGGEGWVLAELVQVTGNLANVPREGDGAPATTPIANSGAVNLRVGAVALAPTVPLCNTPFVVSLEVVNDGGMTAPAGAVLVLDAYAADGSVQGRGEGAFAAIQPGATARVDVTLTVTTYYSEAHRLTLTIDPNDGIIESNPNDNAVMVEYTLAKGDCP
ncbi:MAG: SH3 domain-containing protein [Chloroflexota bacterium]|nr:SH3 domain-containing protein [Chloroflexota bacterium]